MDIIPYLILLALAVFNICGIVIWAMSENRVMKGQPPLLRQTWSLMEIFLGLQAALAVTIIPLGAVFLAVAAVTPAESRMDYQWLSDKPAVLMMIGLIATVLQQLAFLAVSDAFIRVRFKLAWDMLGLGSKIRLWELLAGLACGIAIAIIGSSTGFFTERAWALIFGENALNAIANNDTSAALNALIKSIAVSLPGIIIAVGVIGVLAPIAEEMLFRALIFNALRIRCGVGWAIIISGFVFGLAHASALGTPALVLIGAILAWTYYRTCSLWVVIIAHAVNNFAGVIGIILSK